MTMKRTMPFLAALIIAVPAVLTAGPVQDRPAFKLRVAAEQANLREKPDIGSSIIQQIPEGTILTADRKEGEWFYVRYTLDDGGVMGGYIHESLVVVLEDNRGTAEKEAAAKDNAPPRTAQAPAPAKAGSPKAEAPRSRRLSDHPLEVSISAGPGFLSPTELNDGAVGMAGYEAASYSSTWSGGIGSLRWVPGLGVDLTYRIETWLAVGLHYELSHGRNQSTVGIVSAADSAAVTVRPEVSITPLLATARFYPAPGFYIRAGLGAYTVKAEYLYRLETDSGWQQRSGRAKDTCFGLETALGGDLKLSGNWSFFGEVGFRMASVGNLDGQETFSDSDGSVTVTNGSLWTFKEQGLDGKNYDMVLISNGKPSGTGISSATRTEVNISGVILRIGLRFRF